jgi:precorrin-8X/cobalt-precorrin-8 methylmutase
MQNSKGARITEESFRIIQERLGSFAAAPDVTEIVVRIAHTTGDVTFGTEHVISEDALAAGVEAARAGCHIITDVEMVRTGIRREWADKLGCAVECFLNDTEVIAEAARSEATRSELGMRRAGELLNGALVAIGNAPTALFELLRMIEEGRVRPALIIGVPVGFVGALESKQALYDSGFPGITNLSERGGSPIAAAIVNGILALAMRPLES